MVFPYTTPLFANTKNPESYTAKRRYKTPVMKTVLHVANDMKKHEFRRLINRSPAIYGSRVETFRPYPQTYTVIRLKLKINLMITSRYKSGQAKDIANQLFLFF
jgi:hypothetical protein